MSREEEIVEAVKKRYGAVIDLAERPRELIDILRRFAVDFLADSPDGGLLPGGVPNPPPPPGPEEMGGRPTTVELMAEILKISQRLANIEAQLAARAVE